MTVPLSDPSKLAKDVPALPISPSAPCPKIKSWECKLPCKYIVASTSSTHSLNLAIELQTTDTGQILSVSALLDSGVTRFLVIPAIAIVHHMNTCSLSYLIPVYNVDGSPNKAGAIREVVDLVFHYKYHSEHVLFAVTQLGKQKVILGHLWL
ncbi:hypothetical protein L208DRAFT_1496130 [Tricholoma matsutake]|nr:hypothetical protein L208DRAFT_1496130 [Tricholoma matsutake 945]